MNKFQFLGRLTKEPEVRYTSETNTKIALFTLAVNRKYVEQGKSREADFFNLTAYGKTAEFVEKYFDKGQQVLVEGRIQNRRWQDKEGKIKYTTDYIVEQTYFADSKNEKQNEQDDFVNVSIDEESLPF